MTWLPVIDSFRGGYCEGFDPNTEYEFQRGDDEKIEIYKLADVSPYFNVAGLYWRPLARDTTLEG